MSHEVEARPANADLMHPGQMDVAGRIVDHPDACVAALAPLEGVEHRSVVGAVA